MIGSPLRIFEHKEAKQSRHADARSALGKVVGLVAKLWP